MKNSATKSQAANLIRDAVKSGWTRTVDAMSLGAGRPWCLQVNLSKRQMFANGYEKNSAQIIVSFRKTSRRWVVSIASRYGFQRDMKRGLWSALYHVSEMKEAA